MSKKIFIIAGEISGDRIASQIVEKLRKYDGEIEFACVGGEHLATLGINSIFPMEEISLMGFVEIIPKIFKLKKLINKTIEHIKNFDPDIVITIDSPGFNHRVASALKNNIRAKLVHIVAPSVWAYNPARAKKYAKIYDLLLALLPFEPPYFEKYGLKTIFVGNFALEQKLCEDPNIFREKLAINENYKIISITPGSRESEVNFHIPIFIEALEKLQKKYKIFANFIAANENIKKIIDSFLVQSSIKDSAISLDRKFESIKASDVAIAKSGTNSLEIAMHDVPQIIAYKLNFLSGLYLKFIAKIKYANLINIIADKEIIPEFLQENCTSEKIACSVDQLLSDEEMQENQIRASKEILSKMLVDGRLPSEMAAKSIMEILSARS